MANVKDITRESWILNTFPEWGTWLNEEIEEEVVPKNNFAMWWLGNCGVWIKTPGGANIVMDLWSNRGKSTKKVKDMVWGHQMANMAGVRKLQPNLRVQPMVIDPFAINELDYYLVSHFHSDHIDINTAAAIVNNPKLDHVKFVGPYECGEIWKKWGVPEERIIIIKPGESFEFKDVKVTAVESFDRTCLVTLPVDGAKENNDSLKGLAVTDEEMARKAVNYIFETPGGTIYHGADSHFSNYFAKHGKDFDIDVAINNYGDNPIGIQDKMTSIDLLRMAENLRAKVIIPVHYDIGQTLWLQRMKSLLSGRCAKNAYNISSTHLSGKLVVNMFIHKIKTVLNITTHVVLMMCLSTIQISSLKLYFSRIKGCYQPFILSEKMKRRQTMKFFLDTADVSAIKTINELGVVDGVTTNPTIISREGRDFETVIKEICQIVDGPVSAEVTGVTAEEMITEARDIAKWADNIVVKIPMTMEGLKAVNVLSKENIKTNVTLIFTVSQGLMAIKAGATFISPFVGRLEDIGTDAYQLISDLREIIDFYDFDTEIIAASIRNTVHVENVAKRGAHIATIPDAVFDKMTKHPLTDSGLTQFMQDWKIFKGE